MARRSGTTASTDDGQFEIDGDRCSVREIAF
jgi:hypothetical protein